MSYIPFSHTPKPTKNFGYSCLSRPGVGSVVDCNVGARDGVRRNRPIEGMMEYNGYFIQETNTERVRNQKIQVKRDDGHSYTLLKEFSYHRRYQYQKEEAIRKARRYIDSLIAKET